MTQAVPIGYRKNKRPFSLEEYCCVSRVVKHASPRSRTGESGTFRAIDRPSVPNFEAVWRRARVKVKGDCRLGG